MWNKRPLTVAFAALSLAGCGVGDVEPSKQPPLVPYNHLTQQVSAQPIPLEKVPTHVHRRAAQLLEDVRGTASAPNWKGASLAPEVMPLYRPDVLGAAYYEFRVLVGQEPAGYIIASTGAHDYPISHWGFEGLALTEQLFRKAGGKEIGAFYKLDALSYAAEGIGGELLATLGQLPPLIQGQDPAWLDKPIEPNDATWVPSTETVDDSKAREVTGTLKLTGPEPAPISLETWQSWEELKAGYAKVFATMAESLRRQAAQEWETEQLAREWGEGLVLDRPFELALLNPVVDFKLLGDGAELVSAELVETAPEQRMLVLTAIAAKSGVEIPLTVELYYGNGMQEALSFVILSPEDVGSQVQEKSASGDSGGVHWAEVGALGSWSAWTTNWAGSGSHQRLYNQMQAGSSPNTSSCYSGCGGTAWAMLFGWGDYQAALGNPSWAHRFGLYRYDGGYGSNVAAPQYMDTGVRNMTWEIRNRIGTFCIAGSGATFPWDMSQASGYLAGRTGASLSTHYNSIGIHEDRLRNTARNSIRDRRVPAIIGTGWLKHYPLAYGYRWRSRTVRKCFILCWNETEYQRAFYVNQGWGGSGNSWVSASTWFAGQLYPN